ncbi:MAG: hypothetical protein WBB08_00530 [Halobacteriota archaeon]
MGLTLNVIAGLRKREGKWITNYEYWVLNDKRRLLSSVEKAKRWISRNGEK